MARTIDLAQLHADVKSLLPPDARFNIEFEIWDGGGLGMTAECWIYHDRTNYSGRTPEEALAKLRHAYRTLPAMEAADLGLVVLPEPAETTKQ